jgi:pyrimidine deaminase RibD-like protein
MLKVEEKFMRDAIEISKKSVSEDNRLHPVVGAIIVKNGECISSAYRGEIKGGHAEYIALKKVENESLENSVVYTTLEPCTSRNHPKIPCAERLVKKGVKHVVIGMLDPNPVISGKGLRFLRKSGIKISLFSDSYMTAVEELNKDFDSQFEVTKTASKKQTIHGFQNLINKIYRSSNVELSIEYLYSYLRRSADFLLVDISKNSTNSEGESNVNQVYFFRTISWLCTLATKLGINLETAYFTKFPNLCPYCLKETCICYRTKKRPDPIMDHVTRKKRILSPYEIGEELKLKYNSILGKNIFGFDYAMKVNSSIYPFNNILWKKAGPAEHIIKIIEELGEIHEIISKFIKGEAPQGSLLFAEELSDVLAWLLSAWGILFPTRSLDSSILGHYTSGCPACKQYSCECALYAGQADNIVGIETVKSVVGTLINLHEITKADIVNSLITITNEAIKRQSDPVIRLVFSEISYQIEIFEASINSTDEFFEEILSLTYGILKIVNPIIEKDSLSIYRPM